MSDCIFCKIVAGEIPTEKVYEDARAIAFLDVSPANYGHTLVVSKEHYQNAYDTPPELFEYLMRLSQRLAKMFRDIGAEGVNIIMNNEAPSGQAVFHTHIHIVPRYADDGLIWGSHKKYPDGEMEKMAEKIRTELKKSA